MRDLRFSSLALDVKAHALCSLLDGGTLEIFGGSPPDADEGPVDVPTDEPRTSRARTSR